MASDLAFDEVYHSATEAEQKEFMKAFIERIEMFPEKRKDGSWIKKIVFNFPVPVDGEEVKELPLETETTVETVVCLSRQNDVHKMRLKSAPFEMIKRGEKTIELRLFDEKRQQIKTGDRIVFMNDANGETLDTTVVKLHKFDSFKELYQSLPLLKCGYTTENLEKAAPSDMEQYYSVEEQRKYGVVGIELCRTDH